MFTISFAVVALQRKCFVKENNILYQCRVSSLTPPGFSEPLVIADTRLLLPVL